LNPAEFRQFLGFTQGSLFELKTQIVLSETLGIGSAEALHRAQLLAQEDSKMLISLINKLHSGNTLKAEG